ncbi:DNA-binding domain-containing protein [Aerolutibacter ruishenii]|uniref:Uncharacterized protein n=1 Tax=Aerolutibacter ruishenii TaxID=686800 RepID=A0A562LSP5_9GAMM|nr:putative DNA-binding domain-containing protein [Lysobacter ruishenii]TWI10558.1 hypothetical protein IP93_01647 [Lysobacter ruishenii]
MATTDAMPTRHAPPHAATDPLAALRTLAGHIRDPDHAPAPEGIEVRRLQVYRELFFNNVQGLLAGNFPVIRRILDDATWMALLRDFYREHPARTPLFPELPREFLHYLDTRADQGRSDPAWLRELAHYEWVELALQLHETTPADVPHDPTGDLLGGQPLISPLAWPLAYHWPVHQLAPDYLPDAPPAAPTLLLLLRRDDGQIDFQALSPLTYRLLERLEAFPQLSGREQLEALGAEAGTDDVEAFVRQGATMLAQLGRDGVLVGTQRA